MTPQLAAIDARHRLTPEEEAVLERADDFVRRLSLAGLPVDCLLSIPVEDLMVAVLAWRRAESHE